MAQPPTPTHLEQSPRFGAFLRWRWVRWLLAVVVVYCVLWGITWLFAPSAVNREFAALFEAEWDRKNNRHPDEFRGKEREPGEFRTDCRFVGEGLHFWPDPIPDRDRFCCVGRPVVPAPLVVRTEDGWVADANDGAAGCVTWIWTPWAVYPIQDHSAWMF
jgi:hypothetical protein